MRGEGEPVFEHDFPGECDEVAEIGLGPNLPYTNNITSSPPSQSKGARMLFTSIHESLREFQRIENLDAAATLEWLKELAL